jgi:hypothetical protein
MFHAVCLQIVPAKMENPDNEDIIIRLYFANCCWNSAIHRYFFPFPAMFYLPGADHVILFVHDVVTSNVS